MPNTALALLDTVPEPAIAVEGAQRAAGRLVWDGLL
jgi:hypothetical protein